jgi:HD-GYP domain-containing protein (c-di-GMP phosphodiesterase class II)
MVAEYAAGHHEKLDGTGYFRHLKKDELPLQSRIMAIADIFEALTAKDRPYKKPMKLSQALQILSSLKEDGHIDPDIHDLVISSNLLLEYAKAFMNPDQIDNT